MKKPIQKEMLIKVLNLYQNKLSEKFLYRPLSPSVQYEVEAFLNYTQRSYQQTETREEWHVPVVVTFENNSISLKPVLGNYELY